MSAIQAAETYAKVQLYFSYRKYTLVVNYVVYIIMPIFPPIHLLTITLSLYPPTACVCSDYAHHYAWQSPTFFLVVCKAEHQSKSKSLLLFLNLCSLLCKQFYTVTTANLAYWPEPNTGPPSKTHGVN